MAPSPEWLNSDMLVKGLFLALVWFVVRTLKKIDDNQALLFERQTRHGEALAELRGEHNACRSKDRKG